MSSDFSAVLEQALDLLVSEPNGSAAERFEDGGVTAQQFRHVVICEVDELEAKLIAASKTCLAASVGLFREGLASLYRWLDTVHKGTIDTGTGFVGLTEEEDDDYDYVENCTGRENGAHNEHNEPEGAATNQLEDVDECTLNLFYNSREKFRKAREEYLTVLGHGTLSTRDKIMLVKIQIAASLLENLERPSEGLDICQLRLDELHALPVVRQIFTDELSKNDYSAIRNEERAAIFASVCRINHAIFSVTLAFGAGLRDYLSSCVITSDERVHPLLDGRLVQRLHALGFGYLDVTWSFGQRGKKPGHKLVEPWDVTTDSQGRYLVADWGGDSVKVFDSDGTFLHCLCVAADDPDTDLTFSPCSVATDAADNVYVLAVVEDGVGEQSQGVYVFDKHANLHHKFPLPQRDEFEGWSLTVTGVAEPSEVVVLGECAGTYRFDVYQTSGEFVHSFDEAIVGNASHIASTHDGRVMVADSKYDRVCILEFDSWGVHLRNFQVRGFPKGGITFNPVTGHVIVTSSPHSEQVVHVQFEVYTIDGEFIHAIALDADAAAELGGATITPGGRIAIVNETERKIHVI